MLLQVGTAVPGAVIDDNDDDDDWARERSSGLAGCQIGDSRDSRWFWDWQLFEGCHTHDVKSTTKQGDVKQQVGGVDGC